MTPPFISLAKVRALGVVVAWHEGIAIAQRCAEQIPPTGVRAGFDTCAISVSGAVRVGGVSAEPFTQDALLALATALVDRQDAPTQLVAALSRAGVAESLTREELMRELAFFSRPDATTAIAAVAARTLAKEAEAATQDEFERLRAEAIATPPKAVPVRRQLPTQRVWMAAGGIGAILAASAAVWIGPWPSAMAWPSTPVLAESSPVTAVTTTIDRLLARGLQTLGAATSEPPAVESPAPPPASGMAQRRVTGAVAAMAAPVNADTESPAPAPLADAASPLEATIETVEDEEPPRFDTNVYSLQDQEVEPPTLAHPQLPSTLSEAGQNDSSHLELLVSESGTVERVRLRSAHSTVHERMLVSAAKAWRFRPAVKDGRPVKYVTRIAVPR
jgi:Gram-negative bacterial TonB protein C-terminal